MPLLLPQQIFFYIAGANEYPGLLQFCHGLITLGSLQFILALQKLAAAQGVLHLARQFHYNFLRTAVFMHQIRHYTMKFRQRAAHHRVRNRFLLFNGCNSAQFSRPLLVLSYPSGYKFFFVGIIKMPLFYFLQ